MKKSKRGIIVSDLHCGHLCGLTPSDYQVKEGGALEHIGAIQREMWNFWAGLADSYGPFDFGICNGDAIDGKGERSGGTEIMYADRSVQADMAIASLEALGAKSWALTYGTPYHVGKDEDWESRVAEGVGGTIGSHEFLDVGGVTLDCKHHIGTSAIPHGRNTAIARDRLWSDLWAERGNHPKANVLIRSHAHYFTYNGDFDRVNIITPGMQWDSKYGKRRCSGTIDLGVIICEIVGGKFNWQPVKLDMTFAASVVTKL